MFDVEKIRGEFPILGREVYGKPLVYLDNGATAQKPLAVIETIDYLNRELNANIHRGVHYLSEEATTLYEASRERIPRLYRGGGEGRGDFHGRRDGFAQYGGLCVGREIRPCGRQHRRQRNGTPLQYRSVADAVRTQRSRDPGSPFDDEGRLRTELLPSLLDGRTRAVAVTQASNTLGTRPELRGIIDAAHAVGAIAVVDGCQGVVHGGADMQELDCDFYAFSGHKLFAPTGTACCTANARCWRRCRRFWAAGTWSIR